MEAEMLGRLTALWARIKPVLAMCGVAVLQGAGRAHQQWLDLAARIVAVAKWAVAFAAHAAYTAVMFVWLVINIAVRWAIEFVYGRAMALWCWFKPLPLRFMRGIARSIVYVYDGLVLSWLWFMDVNRRFSRWITSKMPQRKRYRYPIHLASFGFSWLLILSGVLITTIPTWEETEQVWNLKHQYSITFLDRTGEVLGYRGGAMDTSYELRDYPPYLVKSVLATEDHRFYQHWGIDPIGLAGALWWNINHKGQREKGGSTITQQVVKNIWLTPEHTLTRKITEAWLAIWMENHLGKDEILRLYFERAYMGAGNYGLSAAARYYFAKPITDVTVPEAAMLAGLFKAPVNLSPSSNYDGALKRSAVVLRGMRDQGVIDEPTYQWSMNHPPRVVKADPKPNDWVLDYAYQEATKLIESQHLTAYRSFTMHTTIDAGLQKHAEQLIQDKITQQGDKFNAEEGAIVSMGVDGSVRVIVGGYDYQENQFNRAISAHRQPGSAFKPFVYLTALLGGWTPETHVVDSPVTINVFGKPWTPENYGGKYLGEITLRTAMMHSLNTVAVKISQQFGRQKIADVARNAGIESDIQTVASMPLGTNEVTLLELTDAYTTFASGGQHQPHWVISSIENNGETLWQHANTENHEMIFPRDKIESLVSMMNSVVEGGTATKAKLTPLPVAGKTGTTSDYNDAWFIGYTGNLVTGVWYGNDDNDKMEQMTGGTLPAETWHDYMVKAESKETPRGLPGIAYNPPPVVTAVIQPVGTPTAVAPVVKKPHKPRPKPEQDPNPAPVTEAKPCVFFCGTSTQ
jgi:penicillin-binding protein 1A